MKIKPCTLEELKKAVKEGKKVVVYGDKVIFANNSNMDPHEWYRQQIRNGSMPVCIGILEDN